MRLSKRSEYGVKAAVRLASRHADGHRGYVQSREIAEVERLPPKFLESILLALRSAGVLESKVGAGGGYRLARSSESIRVDEVIEALEGVAGGEENPGAEDGCSAGVLAVVALNRRLGEAVGGVLGSMTLRSLLELVEPAEAGVVGARRA